jgi:protein-L-isoaspartate(D-aspartate) O-methyltransferase
MTDLSAARRWFAQDLRLRAPVERNMAIVEAFATVPRERFLGPAPWRLMQEGPPFTTFWTPDRDASWVYHDALVTIDPVRKLNNGAPSLWARTFDQLDLRRGQRVMLVGAGTGYYAAILAEIAGPDGRVIAVEIDGELAARARASLEPWPQVEVVHGDGCVHDPGEVDVIVVCAGATHPAPLWLDRLAPGGRLLVPLTADNWTGFLLRATRLRDLDPNLIVMPQARAAGRFEAASIGPVGIFPCASGRDDESAIRLERALNELRRTSWFADIPIAALHRGEPGADAMDRVWYHAPGFWLERKASG